jgi:hypothetical protein
VDHAVDRYRQTVTARLGARGFVELSGAAAQAGALAAFRRRRVQVSKCGFWETFAFVFDEGAGPGCSALALRIAIGHTVPLPRGLGSGMVVYPVFTVQHAGPELLALIGGKAPKHWAAFEFPVVAELASGQLRRQEKTPVWGAAYFRRMRREADELFAPESPV